MDRISIRKQQNIYAKQRPFPSETHNHAVRRSEQTSDSHRRLPPAIRVKGRRYSISWHESRHNEYGRPPIPSVPGGQHRNIPGAEREESPLPAGSVGKTAVGHTPRPTLPKGTAGRLSSSGRPVNIRFAAIVCLPLFRQRRSEVPVRRRSYDTLRLERSAPPNLLVRRQVNEVSRRHIDTVQVENILLERTEALAGLYLHYLAARRVQTRRTE